MAGTYCMTNTFNLSLIQLYCTDHFSSVYKTLSHTQSNLSLKKTQENDDYPQSILLNLPSKYFLTWTTPHLLVYANIISALDYVIVLNLSSSPLVSLVVCSPNGQGFPLKMWNSLHNYSTNTPHWLLILFITKFNVIVMAYKAGIQCCSRCSYHNPQ